jgi:hypothetical protein
MDKTISALVRGTRNNLTIREKGPPRSGADLLTCA